MDVARGTAYGLRVPRLFLVLCLLLPCAALADDRPIGPAEGKTEVPPNDETRVFVYVDDDGQFHFVDRLDLVPAQYRSRVRETSLASTRVDREQAASRAAQKRRDARLEQARQARIEETKARIEARDAAAKRAAEDPESTEEVPPSRAERLADALTERRSVLEELVALEEGYAEDADQTDAALILRTDHLDKRLTELDRQISGLRKID